MVLWGFSHISYTGVTRSSFVSAYSIPRNKSSSITTRQQNSTTTIITTIDSVGKMKTTTRVSVNLLSDNRTSHNSTVSGAKGISNQDENEERMRWDKSVAMASFLTVVVVIPGFMVTYLLCLSCPKLMDTVLNKAVKPNDGVHVALWRKKTVLETFWRIWIKIIKCKKKTYFYKRSSGIDMENDCFTSYLVLVR